jgi:GT2 family glycosyltransferase
MVDVSIIIVSWNARAYLVKCLESLRSQRSVHPTETIVVDNASADGSADAVEKQFPEVRVIRNEANLGFARANNLGIQRAQARYFALVNSDIEVLDDCIDRMVAYMGGHPRVGVLGPRILNPDDTLQESCQRFPKLWRALAQALGIHRLLPSVAYCSHARTGRVEALTGCFLMARREALEQVGGLDERFFMYGEDLDWCKRFDDAGWEAAYYTGAEVIHHGGRSSANAPVRFYLEMQRANRQYYLKHHGMEAAHVYRYILILHQVLRVLRALLLLPLDRKGSRGMSHKLERSFACLCFLLTLREGQGAGAA